ncbi:MAG: ABC transporter ATP-binding protein [Chloroflexi bacterium]|nr:ABC transporter ATP-binding protein [Chloroflexota bacterium]
MEERDARPAAPPYIQVHGITKRFPAALKGQALVTVLDQVETSIARGEFVVLIGPSGCGKSTLLRIMNGLIPADEGRVTIDGATVQGPAGDRGMVFQSFNLFPWRTALQNVAFGLELHGVGSQERDGRARRLLAAMGLGGFENYYPRQLSGGMQQRVGLARALAIDPEILFMDEPFGSLDAQTKLLMQDELETIVQRHKRTVVFVTHDMEEAVFLADRILIMSQRPAKIIEEVRVDLPRPRMDHMRAAPEFGELKAHIWNQVRTAQEFRPTIGAVDHPTAATHG